MTRSVFANLAFGDLVITAGSCCPIPGSSASLADRESAPFRAIRRLSQETLRRMAEEEGGHDIGAGVDP